MMGKKLISHPDYYGGEDNPCEAIKVIEAHGLGFCLGNAIKYILRSGRKSAGRKKDLRKAMWYIGRVIDQEK